jgi:hypothetical protein
MKKNTKCHRLNFSLFTTTVAGFLLLAQAATAQQWLNSELPPGLVAWWSAEGDFSDLVGTSPGTAGSDVSFTSGKVGTAFQFINTPNSSIHFPNSPGFSPATAR